MAAVRRARLGSADDDAHADDATAQARDVRGDDAATPRRRSLRDRISGLAGPAGLSRRRAADRRFHPDGDRAEEGGLAANPARRFAIDHQRARLALPILATDAAAGEGVVLEPEHFFLVPACDLIEVEDAQIVER